VAIKRTDVEADYPYLTREIGDKLGKNSNFISATIKFLAIKGNSQFHQSVRASKRSVVHRYSEAALDKIQDYLSQNPNFNPYEELRKMKG
jgi:enoyl-[acyl-carrier-protein] reductase (NADH)